MTNSSFLTPPTSRRPLKPLSDAAGVEQVPGVASETDAAKEFAEGSDPTQYMANQMANAGGLVMNTINGTHIGTNATSSTAG